SWRPRPATARSPCPAWAGPTGRHDTSPTRPPDRLPPPTEVVSRASESRAPTATRPRPRPYHAEMTRPRPMTASPVATVVSMIVACDRPETTGIIAAPSATASRTVTLPRADPWRRRTSYAE